LVTQTLELKNCGKYLLWSDAELDIIRQTFDGSRLKTEQIIRLIKANYNIDRTYYGIRHKAGSIGLTRQKNGIYATKWTEEQEEKLRNLIGVYSPGIVAVKLGRSLRSIYQKCHRLGLSNYMRDGWYTINDANQILGVSVPTVRRWIIDGKLKAVQCKSNLMWRIEKRDLKRFIQTYPCELTGRNVDMVQLVDILCGVNHSLKV
jgi:excisionase family DNA binding protein